MIKIIISVFLAIYILWSFVSLTLIGEVDAPKCFKITNYINFGLLALAIIILIIALFSLMVYDGLFG